MEESKFESIKKVKDDLEIKITLWRSYEEWFK